MPNPPHDKDSAGQYVIYLCPMYLKTSESEQINTLFHEASHHDPMFAQDNAYGRTNSRALATSCSQAGDPNAIDCVKAIRNADTLAYFANEAATWRLRTAAAKKKDPLQEIPFLKDHWVLALVALGVVMCCYCVLFAWSCWDRCCSNRQEAEETEQKQNR